MRDFANASENGSDAFGEACSFGSWTSVCVVRCRTAALNKRATLDLPAVLKGKFMQYSGKGFFHKLWVGMMSKTLKTILTDFDYQNYGGVPLLGVNGITIIGHGNSSPLAIKNMCMKAELMVREKINDVIEAKIKDIKSYLQKGE